MRTQIILSLIAGLMILASHTNATRFRFFDDFLISVVPPPNERAEPDEADHVTTAAPLNQTDSQASESGESQPSGTSEGEPSGTSEGEEEDNGLVSDSDVLGYFRDVPREHWSCCMLGKLAGDKGFHCDAHFYQTRIQMRNRNRAHNRKMLLHGPQPDWGMGIMRTFERCVARHSADFHKCCFAASIERRERQRWYFFRDVTRNTQRAPGHAPGHAQAMSAPGH